MIYVCVKDRKVKESEKKREKNIGGVKLYLTPKKKVICVTYGWVMLKYQYT